MRSHFSRFVLIAVWGFLQCSYSFAQNSKIEKKLIQTIQNGGLTANQVGLVLIPTNQQKPVVSINPDRYFSPASISKLITSWAAMAKLGSNHTFKTDVKQFGQSLCIEGGGDPSLVQEQVFAMAEQVASTVKDPINTLYVDDSKLPVQRQYADGFKADFQRAFTTPISALSMNYNSVTVNVKGSEIGKPPEVKITPNIDAFEIQNKATTGAKSKNLQVNVIEKNSKWIIEVRGTVSPKLHKNYYRAVNHPPLYMGHTFAKYFELLTENKITQVIHSPCMPEAQTVYTHHSRPLGEMIIFMNKYSNNMIAEMLFAQLGEQPGTMEGSQYIQKMLRVEHTFDDKMIIENGSGLSRRSSMRPAWFTSFMQLIYRDFLAQPEIFASLGISGVDGTLKRRTKHPKLIKNIRGKTGSLSGVTTLSGIIDTPMWGKCLFSLFFEHPRTPTWKIIDLEKKLFAAIMGETQLKEIK